MSALARRAWERLTHLLGGLLPGARARRIQVPVFEREWLAANSEAHGASGPLWIVLGDSGSQAIGATERRHGYVLGVLDALRAAHPGPRRHHADDAGRVAGGLRRRHRRAPAEPPAVVVAPTRASTAERTRCVGRGLFGPFWRASR